MKRLPLLALATALLIKIALGLPTPTPISTHEVREIEQDTVASASPTPTASLSFGSLNGRKQFSIRAFKNYTNLLAFQLERTHQIAKNLLADPTIAWNSEPLHETTKLLRNYVVQSDASELKKIAPAELPNRYYLAIGTIFVIGIFDNFARHLNITSERERTHDEQLLWIALQRHGYQEYQVEMEKRAMELYDNIVDEMGEYVKSLSPADREKDKELVEGYEMYLQHPERISKSKFGSYLLDVIFKDAAKAYE